jgi:hypothetical protein
VKVEQAVRAAVEAEPVDGVLLLSRVRARVAGRRRTARRIVGITAGAAAVAAIGVVAVTNSADRASVPSDRLDVAAPVPDGLQAVAWRGVRVFVPERWRLYDAQCGTAQSDTVLVPGAIDGCLSPYIPDLTVVVFEAGARVPPPGATEIEISEHPGYRWTEPLERESGVRLVLSLPRQGVTVTVRSPDRQQAADILSTVDVGDRRGDD